LQQKLDLEDEKKELEKIIADLRQQFKIFGDMEGELMKTKQLSDQRFRELVGILSLYPNNQFPKETFL